MKKQMYLLLLTDDTWLWALIDKAIKLLSLKILREMQYKMNETLLQFSSSRERWNE